MYNPDNPGCSPKNSTDQAPSLTAKQEKSKENFNTRREEVRSKLEAHLPVVVTNEEGDTLFLSVDQDRSGTIKINAEKIAEKPKEGI